MPHYLAKSTLGDVGGNQSSVGIQRFDYMGIRTSQTCFNKLNEIFESERLAKEHVKAAAECFNLRRV